MNVLLIDIDTMRPDHMGCYGYRRNTTPNIDRIAAEGVRFENYYCSDAPCLPSRSALVSGMFGIKTGVVGHGGTAADRFSTGLNRDFWDSRDVHNLHQIFRRAGMYCGSVSSFPERHSAWWFNAGFNECYNPGKCGNELGSEATPYALDFLERNADKSWYLHFNIWDPHTPYRTPESFGNPFEGDPLDDFWVDEAVLEKHKKLSCPHGANEIGMYSDNVPPNCPRQLGHIGSLDDLKKHIDGYDCGIAYADQQTGRILDKLHELQIYDNTAIIVTSDHGENQGELGLYAEHGTADNITCRIPMIIKWPGSPQGALDTGLHYSLDLLPTMSELLNVKKADCWDGQSYAPALLHGEACGRPSLVLSQMAHVCQRAARFDDWIYIRTVHDGFHLFDREMLFNVKDDPHEQHDLKAEYPLTAARGAKIILDWQENALLGSDTFQDPMWIVMKEDGPFHTWGALPGYIERLEKTGRADKARFLRERYGLPE